MTDQDQRRSAQFNQVTVDEVHSNVSQEVIEITVDKLKLLLSEYIVNTEKRRSWQTPLSLLITIILVICTTTFKNAFSISASTWGAIFILSGALCFIWLIYELRSMKKSITLDELLDKIKNKQH